MNIYRRILIDLPDFLNTNEKKAIMKIPQMKADGNIAKE
mgnify:CR=1 FL=1|jgi:hypothetical protein